MKVKHFITKHFITISAFYAFIAGATFVSGLISFINGQWFLGILFAVLTCLNLRVALK